MAIISYSELVRIIMEHPDYECKWEKGVPANKCLCIEFADCRDKELIYGHDYQTPSTMEVSADVAEDGFLYTIEFS